MADKWRQRVTLWLDSDTWCWQWVSAGLLLHTHTATGGDTLFHPTVQNTDSHLIATICKSGKLMYIHTYIHAFIETYIRVYICTYARRLCVVFLDCCWQGEEEGRVTVLFATPFISPRVQLATPPWQNSRERFSNLRHHKSKINCWHIPVQ